jgi:hypothetical protein
MGFGLTDRTPNAAAATPDEAAAVSADEADETYEITFAYNPESTPRLRAIADCVVVQVADGVIMTAPMAEFARLDRLDATPTCRALTRSERMRSLAIIFGLGSLGHEHLIEEFRLMQEDGRPVGPRPAEVVEFIMYCDLLMNDSLVYLANASRHMFGFISLHRLAEQHALGETSAAEFAAEAVRVLNIRNDFEAVIEACAASERGEGPIIDPP